MPDNKAPDVYLIAGPTASGKTRAALSLARAIGGEIVNADALQVYRHIPVLTAQPTPEEKGTIAHHLFGVLDPGDRGSAGDWARRAERAFHEIASRGASAIVVGGTGLYFRALTDGLSSTPPIPDAIRAGVARRLEAEGLAAFRERVLAVDPAMARLDPNDRQRHLRAFEVWQATGRPLSSWQAEPGRPLAPSIRGRIVIEPPRKTLYERCDARFLAMLEGGALDEARAIRARLEAGDVDSASPALKALGLADLIAHLEGKVSLDAAIEAAQQNTRRFAKRQLTWFRNQAAGWPRAADGGEAADRLLGQDRG